jgi:hypothetical protein
VLVFEPVDILRCFRIRADFLAPSVIGMGTDAMDCDNTIICQTSDLAMDERDILDSLCLSPCLLLLRWLVEDP